MGNYFTHCHLCCSVPDERISKTNIPARSTDLDNDSNKSVDGSCPTTLPESVILQNPSDTVSPPNVEFGPYVQYSRLHEQTSYKKELEMIRSTKVICSLDLLLQQFAGRCHHEGCSLIRKVGYSVIGACAIIHWSGVHLALLKGSPLHGK